MRSSTSSISSRRWHTSEVPKPRKTARLTACLHAVKWRNWKMHLIWQVNRYDPPQVLPEPKIINLLTDLKEERGVLIPDDWVIYPMMKIRSDLEESLKKYPPIKMGTPDPYNPSK